MRTYIALEIADPRKEIEHLRASVDRDKKRLTELKRLETYVRYVEDLDDRDENNEWEFPHTAALALDFNMSVKELLIAATKAIGAEPIFRHKEYLLLEAVCSERELALVLIRVIQSGEASSALETIFSDPKLQSGILESENKWIDQKFKALNIDLETQSAAREILSSDNEPLSAIEEERSQLKANISAFAFNEKEIKASFDKQFTELSDLNKLPFSTFRECGDLIKYWRAYFGPQELNDLLILRQEKFVEYVHYVSGANASEACSECNNLRYQKGVVEFLRHALPVHFKTTPPAFLSYMKEKLNTTWPWSYIPEHDETRVIVMFLRDEGFKGTLGDFVFVDDLDRDYPELNTQELIQGVASKIDVVNLHAVLEEFNVSQDSFKEQNIIRASVDGISPQYFTQFLSNQTDREISKIFIEALMAL